MLLVDHLSERPQKSVELIFQLGLYHQNGEDGVDEQLLLATIA